MALFGFLSSCIHRNMDGLDRGVLKLQDTGLRWMEQARCITISFQVTDCIGKKTPESHGDSLPAKEIL
jgi:hypothetical protein